MASPQRCARQSRALRIISDQPSDRCGPTPCIPCLLLLGLCRGVKCSGGGRADLTGHLNRTQVLDAAVKPAGCWSKPLDRWRQECTATGTAPPATNLVSGRVWGNDRRDRDPKLFQAAAGLHSSLSAAGVCLASWRGRQHCSGAPSSPHQRLLGEQPARHTIRGSWRQGASPAALVPLLAGQPLPLERLGLLARQ